MWRGSDAARSALIWSSIGFESVARTVDRGLALKFSDRSGIGGLADGSLIEVVELRNW